MLIVLQKNYPCSLCYVFKEVGNLILAEVVIVQSPQKVTSMLISGDEV